MLSIRLIGRLFVATLFVSAVVVGNASEPVASPKLLIAYGSYKDRIKYPTVTFYEHDGVSSGKIAGTIPTVDLRSDSHPTLSHDGKLCAFASELENNTSRILLWDMINKQMVDLPLVNDSPNSQQHAALSGDGRSLAFATWSRPGFSNRWDVLVFDIPSKQFATPTLWNSPVIDERMPALSGDGGLMAFTTNATDGRGATDIVLWDRAAKSVAPLDEMNSAQRDVEPSLSADGRVIAFVSDRPGGAGGRDIYLYDRRSKAFIELPGLNSVANEQMPSLSPDGRYIAFVSERQSGSGERDIFVYDRMTAKLLPTPDLNSKREEIDPCIIRFP